MGHNGGRAQINVTLPNTFNDLPFINACKACGLPWQAQTTGTLTGDWRTLFDSRGYPTQMPTGTGTITWIAHQLWIYGQTGDTWVLDWPGTAAITLTISLVGGGYSTNPISSNRIEYTFTSTPSYQDQVLLCGLTITSMNTNAFAGGNIRLYLKDGSPSCLGTGYETRLSNGEIFDPRWVNRMGPFGCMRWMQYNLGGLGVGKWIDRNPVNAFSYFSVGEIMSTYWCGATSGPTGAMTASQPPSAISSWTQGQKVQFLMTTGPVWRTPTSAVTGSTTTFTDTGHGLSTGNSIQFSINFNWRYMTESTVFGGPVSWSVTVIDANTFSIPFNSTGLVSWASVATPYTLTPTITIGTLPAVKLCVYTSVNFSNPPFAQNAVLTSGDVINAVYDAALGYLFCDNTSASGNPDGAMDRLIPYEIITSFSNLNGQHPWICIPYLVDDDYITNLATFLKSNLGKGLIPRLEYHNEVWNDLRTGYMAARSLVEVGLANHNPFYGHHTAHISDLFSAVYGLTNVGYECIMALQSGGGGAPYGSLSNTQNIDFITNRLINFGYEGQTISSITVGNPTTINMSSPHGYTAGTMVMFTSTVFGGLVTLRDSLLQSPPTPYYVIATGLTATSFQISATLGGPSVTTSGSTAGTLSVCQPSFAKAHALAHAPYIVVPWNFYAVGDTYPNSTQAGGWLDQVYNYTQGGAGKVQAFEWFKGQYINLSQDETNFPSNSAGAFDLIYKLNWYDLFWNKVAKVFGKSCYEYEGGQGIIGNPNAPGGIDGGLPANAPTSGVSITIANATAFVIDYLASPQHAALTTQHLNESAAAGTLFPAQYVLADKQARGYYWGMWQLNPDANGFVDSTAPPAYTALLNWNNARPAQKNIVGGF